MELNLFISGLRYNKGAEFAQISQYVDKEAADLLAPSIKESTVVGNILPSKTIKWKIRNYIKHSQFSLSPNEIEKVLIDEGILLKEYQLYNCIKHLKQQGIIVQVNTGKNKNSKYLYNNNNKFEKMYENLMKK